MLGAILCTNNILLLIFWLCFLLPLMIITGNVRLHLNFILVVVFPMFAMLTYLNWIILNKTLEEFNNVYMTILKLISYTSIFQISLIIPSNQVYSTFKMWGLKKDILITALGSYIIWIDIISRSDKILTARFARGFISERTFITKLKQLPYLLIPLIVGILRTATERAESWEQKKLIERIEIMKMQNVKYNILLNLVLLVIVLFWLILNSYLRMP